MFFTHLFAAVLLLLSVVPATATEGTRLGNQFPDFTMTEYEGLTSGSQKQLSDFRGVVVLNFWTYRCAPCIKEFPEFRRLREIFKDEKRLHILPVLTKSYPEVGIPWGRSLGYSGPLFNARQLRNEGVALAEVGFPQNYIVINDGAGRTVAYFFAGALPWSNSEYVRYLRELIARLPVAE